MTKRFILTSLVTIYVMSFLTISSVSINKVTRTLAVDATTTTPTAPPAATTPAADSTATTPQKSALETALNSLQAQRTNTIPAPVANPAAQQAANQNATVTTEQLNQYIATQAKNLAQQQKTPAWQLYFVSGIYLVTIIIGWVFLWFAIGTMRIWMNLNLKRR